MRPHIVAVAVLGSVLLLAPNRALAQNVDKAFQLGLGTPLVSHSALTTELQTANAEFDIDVNTTSWGIHNDVWLELGYGLSNSLVLGGLLQLGGSSVTTEDEDPDTADQTQSTFEVTLGPKLDYMFSEGSKVRPFVTGFLGLAHAKSTDPDDDDTSLTGVAVQVGGGLRWFAAPGFSLDPSLRLGWMTASGDAEAGDISRDISASGLTVSLGIGVSGWIQ